MNVSETFKRAHTNVGDVPGTGPCPVIIDRDDLMAVAPLWEQYTVLVEEDADAVQAFGWVREMYGYSFAAGKMGIRHNMLPAEAGSLFAQPPADQIIREHTAVLHYTWGAEFRKDNGTGEMVWQWDKRLFTNGLPHHLYPLPPPITFDGPTYYLQVNGK